MAIAIHPRETPRTEHEGTRTSLTSTQVWRELERASFAVVGYVTPHGAARSSGVVYATVGDRLFFVVAPDSWKARHIASSHEVSVTVPVRRGGILALIWPIPPATISFHGRATVRTAGKVAASSQKLQALVPAERRDEAVVIEVVPYGEFLTYGIGVSLTSMRQPEKARAIVPVGR